MLAFRDELYKEASVGTAAGRLVSSASRGMGRAGRWTWDALRTGGREAVSIPYELIKNPVKSLKGGVDYIRSPSTSNLERAMIVGGEPLFAGMELSSSETGSGRKKGWGERVGRAAGGLATGIAGARAGAIGQIGSALIGTELGGLAGRGADVVKRKGLTALRRDMPAPQEAAQEAVQNQVANRQGQLQLGRQALGKIPMKVASAQRDEMALLMIRGG